MPHYNPAITRLLDEFSRRLDFIEMTSAMVGPYERIEPYIVRQRVRHIEFDTIIFNLNTKLWYDVTYEEPSLVLYTDHDFVRPGDCIFDLGCNTGMLTTWLGLRASETGRVFAFDIFPWNILATEFNARLNGLTNVIATQTGISNRAELAMLNSFHSADIYKRGGTGDCARNIIATPLMPLDTFASLRPTFIKIDIDGAERDVLTPHCKLLATRPRIFLELHPEIIREAGSDPADVLMALISAGYRCHKDVPNGTLYDPNDGAPLTYGYFCV